MALRREEGGVMETLKKNMEYRYFAISKFGQIQIILLFLYIYIIIELFTYYISSCPYNGWLWSDFFNACFFGPHPNSLTNPNHIVVRLYISPYPR